MVPEINLLPKRERRGSRNRLISLIVIGMLILFLLFFFFQSISLSKNITSLMQENEQLLAKKEALELQLHLMEMSEDIDLPTIVSMLEAISYPSSPLVAEIKKYMPDHAYLRQVIFSNTSIQFSIDFETMSDTVLYVEHLLKSDYVDDVKVDEIAKVEYEDGLIVRYSNRFIVTLSPEYVSSGGDM